MPLAAAIEYQKASKQTYTICLSFLFFCIFSDYLVAYTIIILVESYGPIRDIQQIQPCG